MSSKNTNKLNVPEARNAMDKFKMEAASEVGVNLKEGYNGDLTSREAGSVGGQMVKKMIPVQTASFQRADRTARGHQVTVTYWAGLYL
ncbi:MAG: alpha/beta-type small acid-soluble spore protein [Oscillibacter sp.]|nr:alpha/beta-type small acid-soluble spore protein [Oscillibacter sp.]